QQAKLGTLSDLTSGVVVIALGSSKDANATAQIVVQVGTGKNLSRGAPGAGKPKTGKP
ncbi:MAG: hypothetical protein HY257_08820, partial [Chloroflexi bacterium]|nr:hypothetical protein [Chloroflexota bacterium]